MISLMHRYLRDDAFEIVIGSDNSELRPKKCRMQDGHIHDASCGRL